jgi:hypothetical protein
MGFSFACYFRIVEERHRIIINKNIQFVMKATIQYLITIQFFLWGLALQGQVKVVLSMDSVCPGIICQKIVHVAVSVTGDNVLKIEMRVRGDNKWKTVGRHVWSLCGRDPDRFIKNDTIIFEDDLNLAVALYKDSTILKHLDTYSSHISVRYKVRAGINNDTIQWFYSNPVNIYFSEIKTEDKNAMSYIWKSAYEIGDFFEEFRFGGGERNHIESIYQIYPTSELANFARYALIKERFLEVRWMLHKDHKQSYNSAYCKIYQNELEYILTQTRSDLLIKSIEWDLSSIQRRTF